MMLIGAMLAKEPALAAFGMAPSNAVLHKLTWGPGIAQAGGG
jgi:hypothetical protein